MFERGLSHRGLPLKRKFRPRCWVSRRNVHRAQDEAWSRPDRRSTATALVFGHANIGLCHDFGVRPHDARTRVQLASRTATTPQVNRAAAPPLTPSLRTLASGTGPVAPAYAALCSLQAGSRESARLRHPRTQDNLAFV